MRLRQIAGSALLVGPGAAAAADEASDPRFELGVIEVIAEPEKGWFEPLETTIDIEEMRLFDRQDVAETVDLLSGVNVQNVGARSERLVFVRGFNSRQGADGSLGKRAAISARLAQPLIGMGLLEAVPKAVLLALADPEDADGEGVSGRPNRIRTDDGKLRLGRFGWKANQVGLRAQTVAALFNEQGITTPDRPGPTCTPVQADCLAAPDGGEPELAEADLQAIVWFMRTTPARVRRDLDRPAVRRGAALFDAAGCSACHTPTLVTGRVADLPALSNQRIHPFTDLLLHDLGPGLADGRPDHAASGAEWRTPPLWGIGCAEEISTQSFLHDGRAHSLEEAILWHGGEADRARRAFISSSTGDRRALLAFLRSL